jgi:hypothetical protein
MNLSEFENALVQIERRLVPELYIALQKIGEATKDVARTLPGVEQSGWPALAESTIADKMKKGFPVPSPLKRTGEMAESYSSELRPGQLAVAIGSPEKKALWHELGTSRMPPRPVLAKAMREILPFARKALLESVKATMMGKFLP